MTHIVEHKYISKISKKFYAMLKEYNIDIHEIIPESFLQLQGKRVKKYITLIGKKNVVAPISIHEYLLNIFSEESEYVFIKGYDKNNVIFNNNIMDATHIYMIKEIYYPSNFEYDFDRKKYKFTIDYDVKHLGRYFPIIINVELEFNCDVTLVIGNEMFKVREDSISKNVKIKIDLLCSMAQYMKIYINESDINDVKCMFSFIGIYPSLANQDTSNVMIIDNENNRWISRNYQYVKYKHPENDKSSDDEKYLAKTKEETGLYSIFS